MYPYMTLWEDAEIVHSQVIEEDGKQKVVVCFERPTEDGAASARCEAYISKQADIVYNIEEP